MNPLILLEQLLPFVTQLTSLFNQIKQDHPAEWAQVSANYERALADLKAAVPQQ
jgi:hypothetical protein